MPSHASYLRVIAKMTRITGHGRRLPSPRWMCDRYGKCVTGKIGQTVTQETLYYHTLNLLCDRYDGCDSFFEFVLAFIFKALFFLKMNFNSKLPVTPVTHFYSPHSSWVLILLKLSQMPFLPVTHLSQTPLYLSHTPVLTVNRVQKPLLFSSIYLNRTKQH